MEVEPKTVEVRKLLGPRFESTARITGLDPDERISVNGTSGPLPFEGSWNFEPVFARVLKKDAEANLGNLRDVLEDRA